MRDVVNFVDAHRGKWDSWVTDTLTPILISDGKIYLTLGPPTKDPTNYFWTVLQELQELARTTKLPDAELLLNFADTPIVYAADGGEPTGPGIPVFSYCKSDRFLDVLIPGYYTPDRVCRQYRREGANKRHPWRGKEKRAFARYTHFCKRTKQVDAFNRPLPPCARSYFAALAQSSPVGASRLDVHPMNVVNDTSDPSLLHGKRLLKAGASLPLSEHGKFAYLLDTDGFTSAYKLQQLLATNSLVLHHRSVWRAYYYKALHEYVHYVPIWRSSADDVIRTIDWLREHDAIAERIAMHGQAFACDHLTSPSRLCYWRKAIELYAEAFHRGGGAGSGRASRDGEQGDSSPISLERRPRAFPLDRLNIMCRVRDAPIVCYYNIKPPSAKGVTARLPDGYKCRKPVPGSQGAFEECWYEGRQPAAI